MIADQFKASHLLKVRLVGFKQRKLERDEIIENHSQLVVTIMLSLAQIRQSATVPNSRQMIYIFFCVNIVVENC